LSTALILLIATSWVLGFRHGIDWDHIAAVADIASGQPAPGLAILYGSMYALGHSVIIFGVGLLAILLGLNLPPWIDGLMEHIVGATLLLLGLWVLITVIREGKSFRLRSRWMLLIEAVKQTLARLFPAQHGHHSPQKEHSEYQTYGARGCFALGLIHGAGAETPTQVVLFATAAGAGGATTGSLVLLAFVFGLLICNSGMSLLASLGFRQARHRMVFSLSLGILTGIFSSIVGVLFLLGKSALLPAFLGG
jgi:high-affinity nickel-transport protein